MIKFSNLSLIIIFFTSLNFNQHNLFYTKNREMKIKIGSQVFMAVLYDNPTAEKFKALLPMTLNMKELNNNEKYADIPGNLNTNPINPGKIESGDIMIYDTNTLVLFYKSFRTNYSYTKIGQIKDPKGLAAALGDTDINISFGLISTE
jgi:hypothetical protein